MFIFKIKVAPFEIYWLQSRAFTLKVSLLHFFAPHLSKFSTTGLVVRVIAHKHDQPNNRGNRVIWSRSHCQPVGENSFILGRCVPIWWTNLEPCVRDVTWETWVASSVWLRWPYKERLTVFRAVKPELAHALPCLMWTPRVRACKWRILKACFLWKISFLSH